MSQTIPLAKMSDINAETQPQPDLLAAASNAAATIDAIYQWLERVEAAGGATSISGIASCNAMLKSLRKNAERTETLVMAPIRVAIAAAKATGQS